LDPIAPDLWRQAATVATAASIAGVKKVFSAKVFFKNFFIVKKITHLGTNIQY
jgi:hypothetical protein